MRGYDYYGGTEQLIPSKLYLLKSFAEDFMEAPGILLQLDFFVEEVFKS
ncbi:hypothetical protein [Bacillus sp. P14.5]|nr:hypothetical protein [Bacillus sp. P14.5]